MLKRIILLAACVMFSSMVSAECVRGVNGKVACGNGESAARYNPNTGKVTTADTNSNGVTTIENNRGGQAVTKNGVGAVQTQGGKTCVKTRNNSGCR